MVRMISSDSRKKTGRIQPKDETGTCEIDAALGIRRNAPRGDWHIQSQGWGPQEWSSAGDCGNHILLRVDDAGCQQTNDRRHTDHKATGYIE